MPRTTLLYTLLLLLLAFATSLAADPSTPAGKTQPGRDLLFFTGPRAVGGTGSADGSEPGDLEDDAPLMRMTYGGSSSGSSISSQTFYTSIGTGSCRNGDGRYPHYGQRQYSGGVNGDTGVRAACNGDQHCLGFWLHPGGGGVTAPGSGAGTYQVFCSQQTTLCDRTGTRGSTDITSVDAGQARNACMKKYSVPQTSLSNDLRSLQSWAGSGSAYLSIGNGECRYNGARVPEGGSVKSFSSEAAAQAACNGEQYCLGYRSSNGNGVPRTTYHFYCSRRSTSSVSICHYQGDVGVIDINSVTTNSPWATCKKKMPSLSSLSSTQSSLQTSLSSLSRRSINLYFSIGDGLCTDGTNSDGHIRTPPSTTSPFSSEAETQAMCNSDHTCIGYACTKTLPGICALYCSCTRRADSNCSTSSCATPPNILGVSDITSVWTSIDAKCMKRMENPTPLYDLLSAVTVGSGGRCASACTICRPATPMPTTDATP